MSDIRRAFQLLDIIQGHPGYAVLCTQCGEAFTDVFGDSLPPSQFVSSEIRSDRDGFHHYLDLVGMCPVAYYRAERAL